MYTCNICNYRTAIRCNFEKHLSTMKHHRNINRVKVKTEAQNEILLRSTRHKKRCEKSQSEPITSELVESMMTIIQKQQTQITDLLERRPREPDRLNEQILQLQKQITELMTSKTPNRNVVVNNLSPLTDENISEHIERLSIDFILQGAKGYADFANRYPFKNHIVCTDKARKKIKYKNAAGEIVDDPHGRILTQRFFQSYADKNRQIITSEYRNLQHQVQEIAQGGNAENSDLTGILTKATHLQEILHFCDEAAEGKDNKFTQEFVSYLTKMI